MVDDLDSSIPHGKSSKSTQSELHGKHAERMPYYSSGNLCAALDDLYQYDDKQICHRVVTAAFKLQCRAQILL